MPLSLSQDVQNLLRCPRCLSPLSLGEEVICSSEGCEAHYPIVDGIPVLIDEDASVFSPGDYTTSRGMPVSGSGTAQRVASLLPKLSHNLKAEANYAAFLDAVRRRSRTSPTSSVAGTAGRPRVLVLGGRIVGSGMDQLVASGDIELVETDVAFGPRTEIICDAHAVPFADASFDGVIAQAVLEHVADPYRAVEEIYRILRPEGIVYAEIPFMQQVHAGAYDFTRFTHLGLRRLFRRFEEIRSGPVQGTGTALAWSVRYLALSFATRRPIRQGIEVLCRLLLFWLKYLDYPTIDKPGSYDAASGYFFLGERSESTLTDRNLVKLYRGLD